MVNSTREEKLTHRGNATDKINLIRLLTIAGKAYLGGLLSHKSDPREEITPWRGAKG